MTFTFTKELLCITASSTPSGLDEYVLSGVRNMSRTLRRNKSHLIHRRVGTLEETITDRWFAEFLCRRYPGLTVERAYERALARFLRDRPAGIFNPPRHYVHTNYTRPERHTARLELHHHILRDEWDDFLSPRIRRGQARRSWF